MTLSAACGVWLLLLGCGGSYPAVVVAPNTKVLPLKFDSSRPAFWNGAEQFRANMSFLGVSAGELAVDIKPECDQQGKVQSVEMLARMSTTGVARWIVRRDGQTVTHVDRETAQPSQQLMEVHDGGPVRKYDLKFSLGRLDFIYVKGDQPEKRGERFVPEEAHPFDVQSAVVLLRSWRARTGDVARFYVAVGRAIWNAQIVYEGAVSLEIGGTTQRAVLISGEARQLPQPNKPSGEPRHFKIWFSENASRTPLRITAEADYGDVEFELRVHNSKPGCGD